MSGDRPKEHGAGGQPTHLERGQWAEDLACRYLLARGLQLIARNVRTRSGELDLVMQHGDHLIFVEVRYRGDHRYGLPEETVTRQKQTRLIAAAARFLQNDTALGHMAVRFDVVAIGAGTAEEPQIRWIADAFTAF